MKHDGLPPVSQSDASHRRISLFAPCLGQEEENAVLNVLRSGWLTTGPLVADPLLGALSDNGGPTATMAPAASSPAVGLGTGCPPTDQRGQPRGEPCTAGAVEAL